MEISYRNNMAEAPPEIPVFAWQETRFEWLWVYRAASAKQEVWSAPADIPNGVFFVEKGRVDIEAHGRRFAVPAGAAFFSAPGPRRHFFAAGTRLLSAGFRCRRPDGLPLYAKGLNLVASTAFCMPSVLHQPYALATTSWPPNGRTYQLPCKFLRTH